MTLTTISGGSSEPVDLKILKGVMVGGMKKNPDDIITTDGKTARNLIAWGKAEIAPKPKPKAKPESKKD